MEQRVKKWLYDILLCIEEVESYVEQANGNYETFSNSLILCRAMERSFEIIGEAMKRITEVNPDIEITDMRDFIGMRNIISHGYDIVSLRTIWDSANKDIPILKNEVEKLLNLK